MSIELFKLDQELGSSFENMISLPACEFSTCHYQSNSGSKQIYKLENTIADEARYSLFSELSNSGLLNGFEAYQLFNDSIYFRFPGAIPLGKHQDLSFLGWAKYIRSGTTFLVVPSSCEPIEILISPESHLIAHDGLMKKSNCLKLTYETFHIPSGSLLRMDANTAYSIPSSDIIRSKLIQLTFSREASPSLRQQYIYQMHLLRQTMVLKKILNSAS